GRKSTKGSIRNRSPSRRRRRDSSRPAISGRRCANRKGSICRGWRATPSAPAQDAWAATRRNESVDRRGIAVNRAGKATAEHAEIAERIAFCCPAFLARSAVAFSAGDRREDHEIQLWAASPLAGLVARDRLRPAVGRPPGFVCFAAGPRTVLVRQFDIAGRTTFVGDIRLRRVHLDVDWFLIRRTHRLRPPGPGPGPPPRPTCRLSPRSPRLRPAN